ncbi:MAG: putative molybdenum carrier protein [Ignavibacteria bacterium]|nr:putative molybdenum carrier protein [Ignavibacteria bacterium]
MENFIKKIVSGGQTGADRAGLDAAKELGIPTGGYAPKNFKTEKGYDESLRMYNLTELDTEDYQERTMRNVESSDGTVIFCNVDEKGLIIGEGTMRTFYTADSYKKPVIVNPDARKFHAWLKHHKIQVLNVAGNRESISPGLYAKTKKFLVKSLSKYFKPKEKKLYEIFLFSKEIDRIKNDNYSGSAALLNSLIDAIVFFLENTPVIPPEDVAKEIDIKTKMILEKHSQLLILQNFFKDLSSKIGRTKMNDEFKEKLSLYLKTYKTKWDKVNDKIADNAIKSVDFKNKTVLTHSNSSTIVKLFEKLAAKNINVKVIQCESRPALEGRRQAKRIAEHGFEVTVIADSSVMNYAGKIDLAVLGTDGIYGKYFLNKIGTYFIALGFKEFKKPLFILTDSRKIDSSKKDCKNSPAEKLHPSSELWNEKNKNISVENLYFEKIPLKYVTKIITENGK